MISNSKCNWCNKRKKSVVKIKIYCKWYNFNICNDCYMNKNLSDKTIRPKSKPFISCFF